MTEIQNEKCFDSWDEVPSRKYWKILQIISKFDGGKNDKYSHEDLSKDVVEILLDKPVSKMKLSKFNEIINHFNENLILKTNDVNKEYTEVLLGKYRFITWEDRDVARATDMMTYQSFYKNDLAELIGHWIGCLMYEVDEKGNPVKIDPDNDLPFYDTTKVDEYSEIYLNTMTPQALYIKDFFL